MSKVGTSHCGEKGVVDGAELGMSLGSGWIRCCSLFECTTFTRFPSLISIFTGLLMRSSFPAIGMDNQTESPTKSGVLRSAGDKLTFDGELLLRGLFQ